MYLLNKKKSKRKEKKKGHVVHSQTPSYSSSTQKIHLFTINIHHSPKTQKPPNTNSEIIFLTSSSSSQPQPKKSKKYNGKNK